MKRRTAKRERGFSLLEVVLALALAAFTILGWTAAQWQAMRAEQALAWREDALLMADSTIENARRADAGDMASQSWRGLAARLLPHGEIVLTNWQAGVRLARVNWVPPASAAQSKSPPHAAFHDEVPEPCGASAAAPRAECVALAFAR